MLKNELTWLGIGPYRYRTIIENRVSSVKVSRRKKSFRALESLFEDYHLDMMIIGYYYLYDTQINN